MKALVLGNAYVTKQLVKTVRAWARYDRDPRMARPFIKTFGKFYADEVRYVTTANLRNLIIPTEKRWWA
ncbi:hypothetical protein [Kocuria sp.]|uniref:hypothetical protein n=1 Tax=Kocuria sp. TaxID=1871328 RepID=UPI0026DFF382|nr:hypothetical protein [Kocuria sp.]MDO5619301.1 hypothetical protein [Kocuria sp.]